MTAVKDIIQDVLISSETTAYLYQMLVTESTHIFFFFYNYPTSNIYMFSYIYKSIYFFIIYIEPSSAF